MTTAETLHDYQRDMIEDVFQCKVRDQYGCTEMAIFVCQCENGRYHINSEYGIVEVVDEMGDTVRAGKEGEVLCTGFVNATMPLIRYRLGDRVTLSENQNCECGRKFPVIDKILGRIDDVLVTPDGRPLGRLDPIFKGTHGIYETQIIQKDIDSLEFKVVKDRNFRPEHIDELIYEIKKRTGNSMKIEVTYVDEIVKDENGKFRSVVSMLKTNI
jgi:phenylacetate-CoA ligase